ncbi:hypothetical protein KUD11_00200 [Roseovarius sp. LXJ103]|uniref:DUF6525 family protein n=1 Tax=Roseovarius carneus TaxID=2853164 RepID=UPI000D605E83|nr:DUF6525 family protein [Roseovarius carneus]MBZ8117061.1 hypothetical protein [Roseovarius carneus]PWE37089.1 hypothetical protein DD563_14725 [Pelagicola sp. LXJ1103]
MNGNLGTTTLKRRRRARDPMRAYDGLPKPLRHWLADAALPWSPASCLRIWNRGRQRGLSHEDILARLVQAEQQALTRDQVSAVSAVGSSVAL